MGLQRLCSSVVVNLEGLANGRGAIQLDASLRRVKVTVSYVTRRFIASLARNVLLVPARASLGHRLRDFQA